MTICTMKKEGGSSSRYLQLELTDQGIIESLSNEPKFKMAKKKVYPSSLISTDGVGFMGNLILGHIATGWSLDKEDEALAKDRHYLLVQLDSTSKAALLAKLLLPGEARKLLRDDKPVFQDKRLVTRVSSMNKPMISLTTMFLKSQLDAMQATILAAAARFAMEVPSLGNFHGEMFSSAALFGDLRNFSLLDDALLDECEAAGIALRLVDFRQLAARPQAFVGF